MTMQNSVQYDVTLLTEDDLYLFNEGNHFHLYEKLGAHVVTRGGIRGTYFAVWAPDAEKVCVTGDFNQWNKTSHALRPRGVSGIWEGFIPGVGKGEKYKFHVCSRYQGYRAAKGDPFAFHGETPPLTASIVWDLDYLWNDEAWMKERGRQNNARSPMAIYEVHIGSWMRVPQEENRSLSYREMAPR